jgi:Arc/MetJ family transcription regulator
MRTTIVIDDTLMADTLRATGLNSKREVVDLALKTLLRLRQQSEIKALRGNITWDGELDAVRRDEQNSRADRRST